MALDNSSMDVGTEFGENSKIGVIKEGSVEIRYDDSQGVFYNRVQCLNRDLSIVMIRAWCEEYFIERRNKSIPRSADKGSKDSGDQDVKAETCTPPSQQIDDVPSHFNNTCNAETTENDTDLVKPQEGIDKDVLAQPLEDVDLSSPPYKDMSIRILEALSATGLRALRYAKEIPNVSKVVANDISQEACEAIENNIKANSLEGIVESKQSNATIAMYESIGADRYDVIDIDPYGSASPFIDAGVQAVSNGGLLIITCTDMAVLAGPHRSACWAKYGGITVPNMPYRHEMALRLVLNAVQTSALRYKRTIEPLGCVSVDFYVRLFIRIRNSGKASSTAPENFSLVYHCQSCKSFAYKRMSNTKGGSSCSQQDAGFSSRCEICDSQRQIGGPFYSSAIHNKTIIRRAICIAEKSNLKTKAHILGMLNIILKELDIPFYWSITALANTIHVNQPQLKIFGSALLNANYEVSISHCAPNCIKTNAPASIIWDIVRTWTKTNPVSKKKQIDGSPGTIILSKPTTHEVDMSFNPKINKIISRDPSHQSYRINPEKYWGPMARPKKIPRISPDGGSRIPIPVGLP